MPRNNGPSRWLTIRPSEKPQMVEQGIYHYTRDDSGTYTRFHLRVDPDGQGYLLVNATIGARLSPSGALIAKELLDGAAEDAILHKVKNSFRGASDADIEHDIYQVNHIILNLTSPGDNYPIINLNDPAVSSRTSRLMAPMRADLVASSFTNIEPILDKLWKVGIPNVTFIYDEESQPEQLIRSVERAEDLGMIAGVRGRALDLSAAGIAKELAYAGADYISLFYASADQQIHDSLVGDGDFIAIEPLFNELLSHEVARVAEFPLVASTIDSLGDSLLALLNMGITNVNFFAIALPDDQVTDDAAGALAASALPQIADIVEEWASEADVRYVWQPPVLRNLALPIGEQVRLGARCSDDLSVRINPGGELIPARGPEIPAGNILHDEWQTIWNHESFRRYRERVEMPTRCEVCPGMAICAADCPREVSGWSQFAGGR